VSILKKQFVLNFLTLVVSFVALLGMIVSFNNTDKKDTNPQEKINALEKSLKTSEEKVNELKETLANAEKELEANKGKSAELETKLSDSENRMGSLEQAFMKLAEQKGEPKPSKDKPEVVEKDGKLTVNVMALNFREGPSLKNKVHRLLYKGEVLTSLKEQKKADGYTWTKVQDKNGKVGWIATQFTKF